MSGGNGHFTQIYRRTTEAFDRMHQFSDAVKNPQLIMAVNALNVVVQARMIERSAALRMPDVMASSRDPRLDPSVYLSYYAPDALEKRLSMKERIDRVQRLTGVDRNLVVLLKVDPRIAVDRIEDRIASEARLRAESGGDSATMRDKWRHMHENVDDLSMLASGYDHAVAALQEVQPTAVAIIDTTEKEKEDVALLTKRAIDAAREGDIKAGDSVELTHESL